MLTPPLVRLLAPLMFCDFAAIDWNEYHSTPEREWLLPYDGLLADRLQQSLQLLPKTTPLLELGCGVRSVTPIHGAQLTMPTPRVSLRQAHRTLRRACTTKVGRMSQQSMLAGRR